MAAITIRTNISQVFSGLAEKLQRLKSREYLLRPVAIETIANMKDRIHIKGEASDGGQIGSYSSGYLRYRENHKRGGDPKVIISLTRQLENDYAVLATDKGYGIGFQNKLNFDKSKWVEETYGKKIFNLTPDEKKYVSDRLNELTNDALNS